MKSHIRQMRIGKCKECRAEIYAMANRFLSVEEIEESKCEDCGGRWHRTVPETKED